MCRLRLSLFPSTMFLLSSAGKLLQNLYIFTWDVLLTFFNLLTPNLNVGYVVPQGIPGANGKRPKFVAPKEGDSLSACPALNALANHRILPHGLRQPHASSGPRLIYARWPQYQVYRDDANRAHIVQLRSNSFSLCPVTAGMLRKNYGTDACDLADISLHNRIEHDTSLIRQDAKFDPDQGKPYLSFTAELLRSATLKDQHGNKIFTAADLSRYSGKRRTDVRATNPDFAFAKIHKLFGSSKQDHRPEPFLKEERIPQGWEPKVRSRMGLTFLAFNSTVSKVESAIKEEPVTAPEESRPATAPVHFCLRH
ncbi:hypothetical protein DFH09DRAFT_1458575 [Mycena vulgaris]|nr:hypothetical protein DFH09DRAFT_1458575 [Mycena vulgaris]